jgi:hypothetical protein
MQSDHAGSNASMLVGVVQHMKQLQRILVLAIGPSVVGLFPFDQPRYCLGDAVYFLRCVGYVPCTPLKDLPFQIVDMGSIARSSFRRML